MRNLDTVIIFLRSNNDIDNIAPIIYKFGETTSINIKLVFRDSTFIDDFRIEYVRQYDNVSISIVDYANGNVISDSRSEDENTSDIRRRLTTKTKTIGRKFPTSLPEKLYSLVTTDDFSDSVSTILTKLTARSENVLLLFDYLPGEKNRLYHIYAAIIKEAQDRDYTTVAVPHGCGSATNSLVRMDRLEQLVAEGEFKKYDASPAELQFHTYERMDIHDYVTIPNNVFKKRFDYFMNENKIKLTGSARYCPEWISVLQHITSTGKLDINSNEYNIVIFLGRRVGYLSRREVILTINLVSSLPNTTVALKNHPRETFIADTNDLYNSESVVFVDNMRSPYILAWGDIFLSTGTSVVIDCIMRNKPLLDLDYLHANRWSYVEYMPECEIQTYDELYHTLVELLTSDTLSEFYDQSNRNRYIEDIVTAGGNDVLQRHIDIFKSIV